MKEAHITTLTFTNSSKSVKSGYASLNKHSFLIFHTNHITARGIVFQISFTFFFMFIPDNQCNNASTEP
ncbi:hypothetical protein HYC85_029885 [Camellia sinensis]|uniref:Uncharacterized protein n=1 Tax=Camellia sinensis TaxID=4442 RepID=A0A7J7G325_CAMSI|nr:hypothetical protein HYC85_029885 [Camellia sinensis]